MSKYMDIPGPYAFLSPCVAKSDEFGDPNTGGLVGYNVTFKKLLESLHEKGVDFYENDHAGYDNEAHGFGSIYSSPGGLKTNVEKHVKDQWIFQIEGQPHVSQFLHDYAKERGNVPFLVDILNCSRGCNTGTGACRGKDEGYTVDRIMHNVHKDVLGSFYAQSDGTDNLNARNDGMDDFNVLNEAAEGKQGETPRPGPDFSRFDQELKLVDFQRRYTPKKITPIFVDRFELEKAFEAMHKPSHEFRTHDCRRCGFATCREMAVAIAKGLNHVENCIDYYRGALKKQGESGG
jgi:hypothetical protein